MTERKQRFSRQLRFVFAALAAFASAYLINRLSVAWIANMDVESTDEQASAFHDGCALFLTLAIPALLGGGVAGLIARQDGYYASVAAFVVWCAVGAGWHFWAIPTVARASGHDRLMHSFLYNPLPALAFGALGGWFVGQFSSGKYSLKDEEPVVVPGSDE